jgi:hypothetical protein
METAMKRNTLIAMAVAGLLAAPFAAQSSVDSDNIQIAQAATSQPQEGRTPPGSPASPGSIDQRSVTGRSSDSAALFERLDRNKDGFVTREEARDAAELQGRFAELDKDNDGKISASEMRELDSGRSATGR